MHALLKWKNKGRVAFLKEEELEDNEISVSALKGELTDPGNVYSGLNPENWQKGSNGSFNVDNASVVNTDSKDLLHGLLHKPCCLLTVEIPEDVGSAFPHQNSLTCQNGFTDSKHQKEDVEDDVEPDSFGSECSLQDTQPCALDSAILAEYRHELDQLKSFEALLVKHREHAMSKLLARDTAAAAWQVKSMNSLRTLIRKKVLKVLELATKLSLPYWLMAADDEAFDTAQHFSAPASALAKRSSKPKDTSRTVLFSTEVEVIGLAAEDYERESHQISEASRMENIVLRAFGTYPDEFPELFGYSW